MAQENGRGVLEGEVVELRNHERQLLRALTLLFGLLEDYSPSWYTEEHHKQVRAALRLHRRNQ